MFNNISFSIPRLYTLAVRVNHFRKSTVTLNTSSDLTALPAFQHSVQVFPTSAPPTYTHTNLGLMFTILPAQCWKKHYSHSCSEKYKGIDARGD